MKTEYKFGISKDRRELSYFQTAEWCRHIATLPKKKSDLRGEKQANSKLLPPDVLTIRSFQTMPRKLAVEISEEKGIAVAYVYQLRRKKNGRYVKWPHLK